MNRTFDFNKFNFKYYWNDEEEFYTEFTKKTETKNTIFLVLAKRGNLDKGCTGKAKFIKESGELLINEKCKNKNESHNKIDFEYFKDCYYKNQYNNINMNKIIFQKFYVKCLVLDNKITNYTDAIINFNKNFKDIKFLLSKDNINYIKYSNTDKTNNLTIEELTKSLKNLQEDIIVDIYPIKT